MEGCGAKTKTVVLSLTGQSRASAVVNLDGFVFFRWGRGNETAGFQVSRMGVEADSERCPRGWKMSPSRMMTRLSSEGVVRLEFLRLAPRLSHSAMMDKWQDRKPARRCPMLIEWLCFWKPVIK